MQSRLRRLGQTLYIVSSVVFIARGQGGLRVLGNDLGPIDEFDIHDHTLEVILEHSMCMFEGLALP